MNFALSWTLSAMDGHYQPWTLLFLGKKLLCLTTTFYRAAFLFLRLDYEAAKFCYYQ